MVLHTSADSCRENHRGRAEQQNSTGQGPALSCASDIVARGITWEKCCSLNPNLGRTLVLSSHILWESSTRKKPQTRNLSELEAVGFISTRWHLKRDVSTRVSALTQRKTTTYSSRAALPGLLAHHWPCLPRPACQCTACEGSAAGQALLSNILFNVGILPLGKVRWSLLPRYGLVRPLVQGCL